MRQIQRICVLLLSCAATGAATTGKAETSSAFEIAVELSMEQNGNKGFSDLMKGKNAFAEAFAMVPKIGSGETARVLAQGAGIVCAAGLTGSRGLGPVYGSLAGAMISEPCEDIARLGSMINTKPRNPVPIEAALIMMGKEYPPAPDLRQASEDAILDYRMSAYEKALEWSDPPEGEALKAELERLRAQRRTFAAEASETVAGVAAQGSGAATAAAQRLASDTVSYQCMGSGGSISPDTIKIRDLDADGAPDILIDHAGIDCTSGKLPLSCGVRACEVHAYLQRGERFDEALVEQAMFLGIGEGSPPEIRLMNHYMDEYVVGWDGGRFSER